MKLISFTMKKNINSFFSYTLLGLMIYLIIFLKLDSFHMRWWDESMYAVNSYEMIHNSNWFSFYYDNIPDLYNTKPPLTVWFQIVFIKAFGYNELALRLPSAIASCLTIIILFNFLAKYFNKLWAWISSLILLTSYGFVHFHTSRTADSDSLLTLFLLLTNIYFIKFILNQSSKNIILFFLFITLAFSIKLYAALLFTPAYLLILIFHKLFKRFTFNWSFLLGFCFFILSIGSLLSLRELDTPGYLHEVIYKDAGRLAMVVENHNESFLFYLENLQKTRYSTWFILALLGIILTLVNPKPNQKTILSSFVILILSYLTIIMLSVTKLTWYDMPLYPYLAVLSAYPIYFIINTIRTNGTELSLQLKYIILAVVFIYPYSIQFGKSQGNVIPTGQMKLEANEIYLFRNLKQNKNLDGIKVFYKGWKGSLLFYKYKLIEKNQTIDLVTNINNLSVNDRVLVCNTELKQALKQEFNLELINSISNSELYLITKQR